MNGNPGALDSVLGRLRFGLHRRVDFIAQTETAECGLACLTMITRHHGHDIDLATLRRRFPASPAGSTLRRLVEIADALSFDARAIRLELDDLAHLQVPCILHWDLRHFVVLESASRNRACILDPAVGRRRMRLREVSGHFTGVALELARKAQFRRLRARRRFPWRSLIGQVRGLGGALAQVFALSVALEILVLLVPLLTQWMIDQAIVLADRDLLLLIAAGMVFAVAFQTAVGALRAWVILWIGTLIKVQWSSNVFSHLLRLPVDFFERRHIGDVVSRIGSIDTVQRTISTRVVETVLDGLMLALTLALIVNYSIGLALVTLSALAIYAVLRWSTYARVEEAMHDQIVRNANMQSETIESVRGISTIKLHNHAGPRAARYANANVEVANSAIRAQRIEIVFNALNKLATGGCRVLTLWLGSLMVLDNAFTVGMLMAFVAYSEQFVARGSALIDKGIELRTLALQGERLSDIVLAPAEKDLSGRFAGAVPNTRIDVDKLSFRYGKGERWILLSCSFRVEAGESVAIVGPSGCGKSTLVKLMLGLLQPSAGGIRIGGVDIRALGLERYRSMIGSVMQDDRLFSGSIADNISFFDPDADAQTIRAVAAAASIDDEIQRMPMGYETPVGDMGSSLSGGQKQRILLARALYRKPAILVLDEATSHLDTDREHDINRVVGALPMTRIIVAHRKETIASAQRIVRLDGRGRIVELKAAPHAA